MTRLLIKQTARCAIALLVLAGTGCARLPYTTRVIADDPRVAVMLQHDVDSAGYSHPLQVSAAGIGAILRGLSLREQVSVPLRWYAEERPPKSVFREDEIAILAPHVAEALAAAEPGQRVYFELRAPGMNLRYDRDVTAGWIAVREAYFHITIEYFHSQQPLTRSSPYDYNYPTPRSAPGSYTLYFEPGRFWVLDPKTHRRAVEFRAFLQTVPEGRPR
ncbi:MAG TPA: hypothetical protein VGA17_08215 [Nitrospiraceae bacterium]|jgi:hypothetical protein